MICRLFVTHVLRSKGTSYGSAMVPLYRAMATYYRLSKVTMFLSATVWPQF